MGFSSSRESRKKSFLFLFSTSEGKKSFLEEGKRERKYGSESPDPLLYFAFFLCKTLQPGGSELKRALYLSVSPPQVSTSLEK